MNKVLLSNGIIGRTYLIGQVKIKNKEIVNQLKNFGVVASEKVKILNYNFKKQAVMIKVMGVNFAMDCAIAKDIIVYG